MNHQFRNHTHRISFRIALRGIWYAFKSQPNFFLMALFGTCALILAYTLDIQTHEWLILVWTIFIVFIAEMINTAIESMVDLITQEWNEHAKIAKDVSSGMVLLAVIGSSIVGAIIFLPRIISLLTS